MPSTISQRISNLAGYPFAELEKIAGKLKADGVDIIDFGVGDPVDPTPAFVREAAKQAIDAHAGTGYPSYVGSQNFRASIASWFQKRFGVSLNPDTEITSSIGSKEAIFNFPLAFVDTGDVVIVPTPGYPPYARGTRFAGGEVFFVPLLEENNFLIDFKAIPEAVAKKAKIIWLNYPNSPTGRNAPDSFYEEAVAWCKKYDVILASDMAYSEIHFEGAPKSVLSFAKEGVIEFHSLSKRSRMTGWRVGFVAGDERLVSAFKKIKTNIDSGTPNFVQDAAIAALGDEQHVSDSCKEYQEKRDALISAFTAVGLPKAQTDATFYVWQRVPAGMKSEDFVKKLLDPAIGIIATPGSWISDTTQDGINPGEGYVRFALVPTVARVQEAAERIKKNLRF